MLPIENMLWSFFWQNEGIKFPDPVCGMCAAAPVQNSCGQSPHRISFSKAAENPPGWIWTGHRFRHAPVPSWHPYFSEWKIMYPSLYDLHIKFPCAFAVRYHLWKTLAHGNLYASAPVAPQGARCWHLFEILLWMRSFHSNISILTNESQYENADIFPIFELHSWD